MIPLDPEEILGAGCSESFRRASSPLFALALGSAFSLAAATCTAAVLAAVDFILPSGGPTLETSVYHGAVYFLLPLWAFTSLFAVVAIPNFFWALLHYAQTEEPTGRRFVVHALIHQFATTGSITLWRCDSLIVAITLWVFHFVFLALLIFTCSLLKNRYRVKHEEHLMAVAAQIDVKKRELADKVHLPPPPKGTEPPKARPLSQEKEE